MSNRHRWVSISLATFLLIHILVLVIVFTNGRGPFLATILNLLTGLSVIIYRGLKQLRIRQHFFELREMFFLGFEATVVGSAVCLFITGNLTWLTIIQFIFLGIHLVCLVLFLIFMLTFKMKRLI